MHIDWQIFVKPYIPIDEYVSDKISSKNTSIFVFFIILGFVISISSITRVEGKSERYPEINPINLKIQELKNTINDLEVKNTMLESEILILNHSITQMLENREKQEILRLSKLTGSHKKIGPGIVLTVSDSDKPVEQGENPNLGLVHNTDLVALVNDLWLGQAEAVSINDQRITAKTGISCVGPTILVNKTRIAPPFTIKAVGDPLILVDSIKNGQVKVLELSGIKYSIEKYNRLEIPADGTIILAGEF